MVLMILDLIVNSKKQGKQPKSIELPYDMAYRLWNEHAPELTKRQVSMPESFYFSHVKIIPTLIARQLVITFREECTCTCGHSHEKFGT